MVLPDTETCVSDDDDKHEKISKWLGISVTGMTLCVKQLLTVLLIKAVNINDELKLTKKIIKLDVNS